MPLYPSTRLLQLCLVLLLAAIFPAFAQANTFVVSNTADSGAGSLRQAIQSTNTPAAGAHTIKFSADFPDNGVILLNSNLPVLFSQSLTIIGESKQPRIDGQSQYALFNVSSVNSNFVLKDLVLQNALVSERGACINSGSDTSIGQLNAERVTFSNCKASGLSMISGGAIYWNRSSGSVSLIDSKFLNNSAEATASSGESSGGALYTNADLYAGGTLFQGNSASAMSDGGALGGAIAVTGTAQFSNINESTFRSNGASPGSVLRGYGGAIYFRCDDCQMQIVRSYLRGNSANYGGAVYAAKYSIGTTVDAYLTLSGSTFYNNSVTQQGAAVRLGSYAWLSALNNTFYNGDASAGAHFGFGSNTEVGFFRANLLAPTYVGTACSGTPTVTQPGFVNFNLFADESCASLAAGALPKSPLGSIAVDETAGLIGVLRFSGSAVIDSITASSICAGIDARGQTRPIDGDGDGNAYCDVGAFEAENPDNILIDGFED